MKRKHNHVFVIWGFIILSLFFSMWLLRILPTEFKGLTIIYAGFVFNYLGAAGTRQKENAWFKKTDFKIKKYILYDFNDDPHIPIRMIFHQLLSYLYLLIGFVLWITLYIFYVSKLITAEDPARYVLLFSTYYSLGVGGLLILVMMLLRAIDLLKYRGEYFVDSKWIN